MERKVSASEGIDLLAQERSIILMTAVGIFSGALLQKVCEV